MSQVKQKFLVLGARHAEGEFEGKQFAFTKLFCLDSTKSDNEAEKGHKVLEFKKKDYNLFDKFKKVELPAICELTLDFDGKYFNLVDFEYVEECLIDTDVLAKYDYEV